MQQHGGLADFWYLDDGDILCDPRLVLPYLMAFDQANSPAGAERNLIKTEVVLLATDEQIQHSEIEWHLDEVRALATVVPASAPGVTLGVATGTLQACKDQLRQKVDVNRSMQQKLQICSDVQTEHVLSRQCLGINKVNHIMRVHGAALWRDGDVLKQFDQHQRVALDRMFPGLTEEGHQQAVLGASVGGLGWRAAVSTALPANLAALILAAPRIQAMAKKATTAGLIPAGLLEARLAAQIDAVQSLYLGELDAPDQAKAKDYLARAVASAEQSWEALIAGGRSSTSAPRADAEYARQGDIPTGADNGTTDGGDADPDSNSRSMVTSHVQGQLARLHDCTKLRKLEQSLKSKCKWSQLNRLKELRHKETCHQWLWHLNPLQGSVMAEADYVAGMQKRLGAKILNYECTCRLCGKHLDPALTTAKCAQSEKLHGVITRWSTLSSEG